MTANAMFKKIAALFLLNIFIFSQAAGAGLDRLSLNPLLKEAIDNNPEILAARKRWEAARVRIPLMKSLDSPTVGLSFMKIQKGTLKLDKTMAGDRMLSISQMFPMFGKLSLKGKIALVQAQMFAAEYRNKELEIINEVKNTYYDLFLNYKEIELNQESLKFLETIAKIAEAKYIVGEMAQEGLFKISLEIASLSNNVVNLKQERLAKEAYLNSLLNREPESPLGKPVLTEEISFAKDISSLYKLTLENEPELLIFSYAIEKNKYAKSLAKKGFFPDLMAEIGLRGITAGGIGPWDLMLAFTVPFWFWTKQRYEVKEAIADLEEAEAAYQAMKNKALAKTKDLFAKIEISKNRINLYRNTQLIILESTVSSLLSAYQSGEGDIMALLDTIRMLIELKLSYYKALAEYNMNLADLERQIGVSLNEVKNE